MRHAVDDLEAKPNVPNGMAPVATAPMHETPRITTFDSRQLDILFHIDPVTDLSRMAPAGHCIQPCLIDSACDKVIGAADRMALLASDMERIDLATIARGMAWLEAAEGPPTVLMLAVSFLSASSQRARTSLMLHAARLQHRTGTSVIWLLTDVPHGVPISRLSDVVALLRPFGRAVFVKTRLDGVAMKAARTARISGLVMAPGQACLSSTDAALWLLQAGKQAHRAAPTLIADDLGWGDLLPMAAAAGFTHAVVRERSNPPAA